MKRIYLIVLLMSITILTLRAQTPKASYTFFQNINNQAENNNFLSYSGAVGSRPELAYDCRRYMDFSPGGHLFINSNASVMSASDTEFTVTFWMRVSDMADQKIIGQASADLKRGFVIGVQDLKIKAEIFGVDGGRSVESIAIDPDVWTHIAVIFKQGEFLKIVINADDFFSNENSPTWAPPETTEVFRIGAAPWDPLFFRYRGDLDDIKVYNQVLNSEQVLSAANFCSYEPIYVDIDATGSNDGLSWENAFTNLQEAIDYNCACAGSPDIWVADGTYRPTQDNPVSSDNGPRDKSFYISKQVKIYGGFRGVETEITNRIDNSETILTGDLGNNQDTAYHVLTMKAEKITSEWLLDRLTIKDGRATGTNENEYGGGIYIIPAPAGGVAVQIAPAISSCSIYNNMATYGGGIGIDFSTDLTVILAPALTNCAVYNNGAYDGGGLYQNVTTSGIMISVLTIDNCTFFNNGANYGGGLYLIGSTNIPWPVEPSIINSILWNNTAAFFGPDIWNNSSSNSGRIDHSLLSSTESVVGGYTYIDTLIQDPMFTNINAVAIDLRPLMDSPAIDAGDNSLVASLYDIRGRPRIMTRTNMNTVDMGAYEHGHPCDLSLRFINTFDKQTYIVITDQDIEISSSIKSLSDMIFQMKNGMTFLEDFEIDLGSELEVNLEGCDNVRRTNNGSDY